MVTKFESRNASKLLVALLAMLMIVAGAAIVLSDEASAAGESEDLGKIITDDSTGTITLDAEKSYTLGGTIDKSAVTSGVTINGNGATVNIASTAYFIGTFNINNVTFVDARTGTPVASIAMNYNTNSVLNFNGVTFQIGENTVYVDDGNDATFTGCKFTSAGVSYVNQSEEQPTNSVKFSGCEGKPDLNLQVDKENASVGVNNSGDSGIVVDDKQEFSTVSVSNNTSVDVKTPLKAEEIVAADENPENVKIVSQDPDNIVTEKNELPIVEDATTNTITGIISEDMDIPAGSVLSNVTVTSGTTITLQGDVTVQNDFRLYGTVTSATKYSVDVTAGATFTAYSGATINDKVLISGEGDIDVSAAMSTMRLGDDIVSDGNTYSQSQIVLIIDSLTIKAGYSLNVNGLLIVEEGVTLTIENGATLNIGETGILATGMTVDGTVVVENGGNLNVNNAKDVTVNGSIESDGVFTVNSDVTVNGEVFIDDSAPENGTPSQIILKAGNGFTVESTGTLTVTGQMDINGIVNKGAIALDGAVVIANSTINMAADGAVVDIVSFTSKTTATNGIATLTVTDLGLVFDSKNDVKVVDGKQNNIYIAPVAADVGVSGILITEGVTSEKDGDVTKYTNTMYVSGNVEAVDERENGPDVGDNDSLATIAMNGKTDLTVAADATLAFGENLTVRLNGGVMNVYGTMDVTVALGNIISGNGEINVSGMVMSGKPLATNGFINAFHYTTGTGSSKVENYTTLATSLANGATDITYMGEVEVLETLTIPAGTTVKAETGAKMTVGDEDNRDVVLTVANGGVVRNGNGGITVMATLTFENNTDGNKGNEPITCDVTIVDGESKTYTNIYTALEAETGTVTLNSGANVYLDKDAEVKSGVTLVVPTGCNLYLLDEVTLTVNGTVENSGNIDNVAEIPTPITAQPTKGAGFDSETNEDASTIVVNGVFKSLNSVAYDTYCIPGAYYQIIDTEGSWYWITPVAIAAGYAAVVENGVVDIYGTNAVGDVDFTATEDAPVTITVKNGADVTFSSISLSYATLKFDENSTAEFDGTVDSADGSIVIVNANGFTVEGTADEDGSYLYLSGTPAQADAEGAKASVTVASGAVTIESKLTINTGVAFSIADAASVTVTGTNGEIESSSMTVTGTLTATDGGMIDIDTVTVRGTLTIADKDDAAKTVAGRADISTLNVGITEKDDVYSGSSAATVNAPSAITQLTLAVVSAESTVSEKLTEKMVSTEFYVEDALWATVYALDGQTTFASTANNVTTYTINAGDLTNCVFEAWTDVDGDKITDAKIGATGFEKVYADLKYDIYVINLRADQNAVSSISIDGNLMQFGMIASSSTGLVADYYYGYTITLEAGSHTVQYQLANGYSGNGVLTVNGVQQSGLTFTTEGNPTDGKDTVVYELQLTGFEKSGYVPDSPDTGDSGSSDSGMTITDYLLIVLVVLIVVMAIIVAMRLMRS